MIPKKKLAENNTHVYYTDGTVLLKRNTPAASPVPENKIEGDKGEGFTPGEWVCFGDGRDIKAKIKSKPEWEWQPIACCYGDDAKKNAMLIAAAPDMYNALKDAITGFKIVNKFDNGYTCENQIEALQAILNRINNK